MESKALVPTCRSIPTQADKLHCSTPIRATHPIESPGRIGAQLETESTMNAFVVKVTKVAALCLIFSFPCAQASGISSSFALRMAHASYPVLTSCCYSCVTICLWAC